MCAVFRIIIFIIYIIFFGNTSYNFSSNKATKNHIPKDVIEILVDVDDDKCVYKVFNNFFVLHLAEVEAL